MHSKTGFDHPRWIGFGIAVFVVLALFSFLPKADIAISALFYRPGVGFLGDDAYLTDLLNKIATTGARVFGGGLAAVFVICWLLRRRLCGLSSRDWAFLLFSLLIGPGLMANVVFKDHWGRARPRDIVVFGGSEQYTPPLVMSDACNNNCSFVAGDASFGFFFPSFAYLVAPSRRRRVFAAGMAVGALFSAARLWAGAHFFSDILYAAVVSIGTAAVLARAIYGKARVRELWNALILNEVPGPQKA